MSMDFFDLYPMKIAIFYRDICSTTSESFEFLNLASALVEKHEVIFWGAYGENLQLHPEGVRFNLYSDFKDLLRKLPVWFQEDGPDVLIVLGFFLPQNLPVVRSAKRHGVPIVLHPLGQVADEVFARKMFTVESNVRFMKQDGVYQDTLRQRIVVAANPYLKRLYKWSVGTLLVNQSDAIIVSSKEEQRQFQQYYNRPHQDFMTLVRGIIPSDVAGSEPATHFYRETLGYNDRMPNLVFWSRIEWYYKGLDRLLNGVKVVRDRVGSDEIPFRLFLIGPDYRGGISKAAKFINDHELQKFVHLLPPGSYPFGSKTPLRDADGLVLLSRWDTGMTRCLREAMFFGVPVMVTSGTHFADVITDYDCGLAIVDANNPDSVADSLLMLISPQNQVDWRKGASLAAQSLTWSLAASQLSHELERFRHKHS
jgi:glycosyltransferase involved in cell wall biosynthesis